MEQHTDGAKRILVIIPTYNEIENVEPITSHLRTAVPEAHILIADDNSPDGTGKLADELAAKDDHIHVNHRKGKEGLGAAYLDSFQWALDQGYDVIVEFDADGSHSPDDLPKLLKALDDGADMVKGSRWVKGGSVVNWPKSREFLSRGGSVYIRMMLGMPIKDVTGGFNAFKAPVLRDIMKEKIDRRGYGIQRDLTWNAFQKGYKIVEVPITFVERVRGDSKMNKTVMVEAMKTTTQMGLANRGRQAKKVLGPLAQQAVTQGKKFAAQAKEQGAQAAEQGKAKAADARTNAQQKAAGLKDQAQQSGTADSLQQKAADLAAKAQAMANEVAGKVQDKAADVKDTAAQKAAQAKDTAAAKAADAKDAAQAKAADVQDKASDAAQQAKIKAQPNDPVTEPRYDGPEAEDGTRYDA